MARSAVTSILAAVTYTIVTGTLIFGVATGASAQGTPAQWQKLEACTVMEDVLERVACYDEAMGRGSGSVADLKKELQEARARAEKAEAQIRQAEEAAEAARAEARAAEEKERARLAELDRLSKTEFGKLDTKVETVDVITAKVEKVKEKRGQRTVIYLTNGQIWRMVEDSFRGVVRKDYDVIIKKAFWNSYKMIVENNGRTLRVKRVK